MESFQEKGVTEDIANIRFQFYEENRKRNSKQVEDVIRTGLIEQLKTELPAIKPAAGALRNSHSVGKPGQRARTGFFSPGRNELAGAGGTVRSTLPPDISLREPLDQEFIINRKMAKKYYET